MWDRRRKTGDRRHESGDVRQYTWNRRQETWQQGDIRDWEMWREMVLWSYMVNVYYRLVILVVGTALLLFTSRRRGSCESEDDRLRRDKEEKIIAAEFDPLQTEGDSFSQRKKRLQGGKANVGIQSYAPRKPRIAQLLFLYFHWKYKLFSFCVIKTNWMF